MGQVFAIVCFVFMVLCGLLFWQVRSLSAENAEFKQANEQLAKNAEAFSGELKEQKERADKLDALLTKRERERAVTAGERAKLLEEIARLKHESESVAAYLDGAIPDGVVRLLQFPDSPGAP